MRTANGNTSRYVRPKGHLKSQPVHVEGEVVVPLQERPEHVEQVDFVAHDPDRSVGDHDIEPAGVCRTEEGRIAAAADGGVVRVVALRLVLAGSQILVAGAIEPAA